VRQAIIHTGVAQALHELLDGHLVEGQGREQQRQLQRTLALLEQAEIGGRDAEELGHLALGQAAGEAQLAQPPSHLSVIVGHVTTLQHLEFVK